MANLNETFEKPEFDWSAISVGDYKLDHSQNFFANKENNRNLNNENHQQQQQLIFSNCATPTCFKLKAEKEQPHDDDDEDEAMLRLKLAKVSFNKETPAPAAAGNPVPQPDETKVDQPVMYDDIESMPEAEAARAVAPRPNLRLQWSPISNEHEGGAGSAGTASAAPVPKAYAFKDLYECNRQQARRRQDEEDRQARQFHSRPMPNFKAMHKRIEDMVVVHRITVPRTPETVKYWKACVERRRQAKTEQDKEDPGHPTNTRHKTFNLLSDQRVRDRRDFDSAVQERQVQKKTEQEEQRKRCEEEEIKKIRKMTVFKARPNPFK